MNLYDLKSYEEVLEKCSYCTACSIKCPVFNAEMDEVFIGRSRMTIIKAALIDEELPVTKRVYEMIDRCLLCTNCTQSCPPKLPVDEVVTAARHHLYKGKRMSLGKRVLAKKIMEKRGVKGLMKQVEIVAKGLGISPKEIPPLPDKPFEDLYSGTFKPVGETRAKAVYFVGCAVNTIYPDTGEAVLTVLKHNGIEVTIPQKMACCGIPAIVEGDIDTAREMIETNIQALESVESDVILTDCTSCGMVLKEKMLKVIPEGDPLRERAVAVSAKVRDIMDYLNEIGITPPTSNVNGSVTYHVPCHSGWMPMVADAPRKALGAVSKTELVEIGEPSCCGAAGAFFVENGELSERIRKPLLEQIEETGVDTVVTQCPSCRTYINAGLDGKTVMHPIALLAEAYKK